MMPRSRIDAASSSSSVSAKLRRGLRGLGLRNSIGTRRWLRPCSTALVSCPTSPMSAARPRPRRERALSSAMPASPELITLRSFYTGACPGQKTGVHFSGTCAGRDHAASRGLLLRRRRRGGFPPQLFLALNDLGREPQIGFAADALQIVD